MEITISFPPGFDVEGVVLSVHGNSMRVAMRHWDDAGVFEFADGDWFAENGDRCDVHTPAAQGHSGMRSLHKATLLTFSASNLVGHKSDNPRAGDFGFMVTAPATLLSRMVNRMLQRIAAVLATAGTCLLLPPCRAGEGPFFVTYTHQMEEPRNLELTTKNVSGKPGDGNRFLGTAAEFEYGAAGWWTTELYLDGQATRQENTVFTGYRWENRFRLIPRELWINPVLYTEFEDINGADKALLEVVGHDGAADLAAPTAEARHEKKRELEAKLILGSYYKGWTIAENFIAEKNLNHAPYELGYAVGISRPLALAARPERCNFCAENVQVGVELYGGLGTHADFGLHETSHYVAPVLAWTLANGTTFHVSAGFGTTGTSAGFLLRFGVSYEVAQVGRAVSSLLRGGRL